MEIWNYGPSKLAIRFYVLKGLFKFGPFLFEAKSMVLLLSIQIRMPHSETNVYVKLILIIVYVIRLA